MDLGSPAVLFSGLLIGLIGAALFIYGKKQQAPRPLLAGAVLCIYPYFVASLAAIWLIFAAVIVGLYFAARAD